MKNSHLLVQDYMKCSDTYYQSRPVNAFILTGRKNADQDELNKF